MRRLLLLGDVLLLVVAAFLGVRLYEAWAARAPVAPAEAPAQTSAEVAAPTAAVAARPPLTAFGVVAERNLFSPTRSETAPETPRAGAGAVVPNDMDVPSGAMALGVPAKIRENSVPPGTFDINVASYVANGKRYRAELRRID